MEISQGPKLLFAPLQRCPPLRASIPTQSPPHLSISASICLSASIPCPRCSFSSSMGWMMSLYSSDSEKQRPCIGGKLDTLLCSLPSREEAASILRQSNHVGDHRREDVIARWSVSWTPAVRGPSPWKCVLPALPTSRLPQGHSLEFLVWCGVETIWPVDGTKA